MEATIQAQWDTSSYSCRYSLAENILGRQQWILVLLQVILYREEV